MSILIAALLAVAATAPVSNGETDSAHFYLEGRVFFGAGGDYAVVYAYEEDDTYLGCSDNLDNRDWYSIDLSGGPAPEDNIKLKCVLYKTLGGTEIKWEYDIDCPEDYVMVGPYVFIHYKNFDFTIAQFP